jgi:two-component system NarL family sensor kinase
MAHAPPHEQQYRELEILNAIAGSLNESVSLAASLGAALSCVAEFLGLQAGWVWLLDETTGSPYLAAAQNLPAALADYPERMAGSCYCLTAFGRGELRNAANVFACSRLEWLTEGTAGLRFHASVPLYASGRKLGVMNVASTEWRELSSSELRLLHIIGDMLGVAIERSRLFERSTATGAAEERNRLAREIHDTLAQGLTAAALQLETADALLEAGSPPEPKANLTKARAAVRRALQMTRQNLEDARRSVLDLRPAPLEGRTLAEALRALCAEHSGGAQCANGSVEPLGETPRVRLHTAGDPRPLPAPLEAGLYRIAREALTNALHHAQATSISIHLAVERERITLTVEDNGLGFEAERFTFERRAAGAGPESRTAHFGVVGMCERMRLLGGKFTLQSAPGAGTRVEAMVPLEPISLD